MSRPMKLLLGIALVLWTSLAGAQSNLGELLDAGARMLSPEEFKREVVQRSLVGPTPTGGTLKSYTHRTGWYREKARTQAM